MSRYVAGGGTPQPHDPKRAGEPEPTVGPTSASGVSSANTGQVPTDPRRTR